MVGICTGPNIFSNQVQLTASDIAAYPTITILLNNGVTLSIPGSQYLYPVGGGYYIMGVGQGNYLLFFSSLLLI